MKNGYDGAGIPISRSGPATSKDNDALPGEAWDSRGAGIKGSSTDNTDVKRGTMKTIDGARAGSIARGGW